MHQQCLIKLLASDAESALNGARDALETYVGNGNTFDYLSDDQTYVVTKGKLAQFGVKTFTALERQFKSATRGNLASVKAMMREEILKAGAKKWLSAEYAPSMLGTDEAMNALGEKALKENWKGALPQTFPEMIDQVAEVLAAAESRPFGSMISYYMDKIHEVTHAIQSKFLQEESLGSTEVHFCDIGDSKDSGASKTFYVHGDRHY